MNQYRKNFCRNLNTLIERHDLKHFELAEKLEIGDSALGSYVQYRNVAPYETIVKISELFNVSIDDLIKTKL